ncbi:chloride channel protein [Hippea maritima]|uniref:Cl-channel voltage-gated family protein n=1 Tax=Hippea maritima (strain ATCC 700847 / DSM 10411 / MH2) TaxID=760142 RepID=F2LXY6_HIPMA|nr:chloride channel protein [Hippea maritima]AEA33251.1 Cl- channel voltage-gated family protein [Hippea maritima DSM 10411]
MKGFFKLFVLPFFVGAIGGFSALFMRELIRYSSKLAVAIDFFNQDSRFYLVIIPILFIISAFTIKNFLNNPTNPTIDSVARSIVLKKGRLDYKKGIATVVLSAINIGFGVPVGREGPIAKLGGSLSSLFLKGMRFENFNVPLLVSCGVSSALAATFNAPIAAVIFGLEIILGRLSFNVIIPLTISSAVGVVISRYFLGNYPAFVVPQLSYNYKLLFLIPLFAFLFAVVVYVFEYVFESSVNFFTKLNLTFYSKALIGGLIVGVLLWLWPDAASLGYKQVSYLFSLKYSYADALMLSLVKMVALAITFASGMFGGIFAPSIFGGAFFGYALGGVIHNFFPFVNPLDVALIGTASISASISSAPFRSTLIVAELAQNYHMILPLMISSVMTVYFSHILQDKINFSRSAMQKGFDLMNEKYRNELIKVKVVNFIDPSIMSLKREQFIKDIVFELMNSSSSYFSVVEDDRLVGVLSFRDVRLVGEFENDKVKVKDIMTPNPNYLTLDSSGLDVFELLSHIDVDYIPIVENDESLRYMGMLDVNAFLKFVSFLYFKENLFRKEEVLKREGK